MRDREERLVLHPATDRPLASLRPVHQVEHRERLTGQLPRTTADQEPAVLAVRATRATAEGTLELERLLWRGLVYAPPGATLPADGAAAPGRADPDFPSMASLTRCSAMACEIQSVTWNDVRRSIRTSGLQRPG